jgi:uncharacterized protein (DUF305 family)
MCINRKMSFTVAVGALALLTACGKNSDSIAGHEGMRGSSPPATTASAQPSATFNDADVMFVQMMIPHHEQASEMAAMASTRAGDPEIKEIAGKIKAEQDSEIQTMKGWLNQWGKPVPQGGMGRGMPGAMSGEDMKKLEAARGKEFDKLFAAQMITHHKAAIEMARAEQTNGLNPQVKELAKAIQNTQEAEIGQLQKILARL